MPVNVTNALLSCATRNPPVMPAQEADIMPNPPVPVTDDALEAAVLRRLLAHLDSRKDVQNIDLMNLAGFCRNCLARWYVEEAARQGRTLDAAAAKQQVYGMPYAEWKRLYQREASAGQLAAFAARPPESA